MTENQTVRDALNRSLDEAMAADERVLVLGEDVADPAGGVSGVTKGLSTKHGADRVLDTPISEAAIVGAAIGAALDGMLPVAEIMIMDFIGIALDQIVNHAAKLRFMSGGRTPCPVTVRTAVFGGLGSGATHSQSLEAWFMHIPGLKVVVPSTPADAKGLLTSAIFDPDPCVFVETVITYGARGPVPTEAGYTVPLGVADIKRAGADVSVITYGRGVFDALHRGVGPGGRRDRRRGRRPADAGAARHAAGARVGRQDEAGRGEPLRDPLRRSRRRAGGDDRPRAVRDARGAGRAGRRPVHPDPGGGLARGRRVPVGRGGGRRGAHHRRGPWVAGAAVVDKWPLRMPKLSMAVTEATLVAWLVADGDVVTDGQALYVVETDKVETEVPSGAAGVVHPVAAPGEVHAVGAELGWIETS